LLGEATGLVKEFGTLNALLMASAAVFALVYTVLQFPWFYGFNPGANLPLALVLARVLEGAVEMGLVDEGQALEWAGMILAGSCPKLFNIDKP
jgi:hypothetical protein